MSNSAGSCRPKAAEAPIETWFAGICRCWPVELGADAYESPRTRRSVRATTLSWSARRSLPWGFRPEPGVPCDLSHRFGIVAGVNFRCYVSPDLGDVGLSPRCSRTSAARGSYSRDHRFEPVMVQQLLSPQKLTSDHEVGLFPAQFAHDVRAEFPARSAVRPAAEPQVRVRKCAIRQVVVIQVAGHLSDVVEDLDKVIQLILADEPRGVVCDLSGVFRGAEPAAVEVLATAGRHVRDWPGIPVAVACPDPQLRQALSAHPLGGHLIVTESLFSARNAVLGAPTLTVARLRLAQHPTAQRASRDFVTRTLLDWRLSRVIPFASLVISELVPSSTASAGTDVDLSVAWDRGALRLTVRDHSTALPGQRHCVLGLHGRGLTVVAVLSRSFGVLPTSEGGKFVWAVLDVPRPIPTTSNAVGNPKPEPARSTGIVRLRGQTASASIGHASNNS